ncbi:MAG: rod-binding protein [Planctomycetota bacterium]|nr:rod-binding protein [Planctomycetota bacterium]
MSGSDIGSIGALPSGELERLTYASKKLEAVWLSHILKEAHGANGSFLEKSMASKMFREMLDEALAEKMAERGTTGLTEILVKRMLPAISSETTSAKE